MPLASPRRSARIPKPADLLPDRKNSAGFLWSDPEIGGPIIARMSKALESPQRAAPLIGGKVRSGAPRDVRDPADRRRVVGEVIEAGEADAIDALALGHRAQEAWDRRGGDARASILERAADLFEAEQNQLMALAVREGGKTLPNALGEVRETVDYLRYYAARARALFEESDQAARTDRRGE